jgi:hypothetical protein
LGGIAAAPVEVAEIPDIIGARAAIASKQKVLLA